MSFIFNVEATDEIKSAKIFCLEGSVEEGNIVSGDKANVIINGKLVSLNIQSVVLINRTKIAQLSKKMTLAIDEPDCDIKQLEGKVIRSF